MHHQRTRQKSRTLITAVILVATIIGALFLLNQWENKGIRRESQEISSRTQDLTQKNMTAYYDGKWYSLRNHIETCLILGIDKTTERMQRVSAGDLVNNLQSDFILLMVVNHEEKSFSAIQINRDTMAEIRRLGYSGQRTGSVTQQLALSHTYGSGGKDSCRNSVNAVSRLFYDVPIDHYYAVTMDAIPVLADLVGGVPVHVEEDLTAADPSLVQGTDVVLKGQQALNYVRARILVSDGTNLSRMNRQSQFMTSLYNRLTDKLKASDRFAFNLAGTLEGYATSDMITDEMAELAEQLSEYRFLGVRQLDGEAVEGEEYIEFYPDEESLRKLTIQMFFTPKI